MVSSLSSNLFVNSSGAAAGRGEVWFEKVGERTAIVGAWARAPLKILTPRRTGDARAAVISTYGGGLVDGDAIALSVRVARGALATIGTQASTKVYRCPRGTASQTLDAEVGEDALLVALPDPLVPFASARYEQRATIRLARDASLAWLDVLACGRAARGERWALSRYASRTRVLRENAVVCEDALVLDAREQDLARALGRFDALATALVFGPALRATRAAFLAAPLPPPRGEITFSASPIGDDGACLRVAGVSTAVVTAFVRERLSPLRATLGDDPFARKW